MPERMEFVGRDDELEEIGQLIGEWRSQSVLFVQGEGGIGKTRLLEEVQARYGGDRESRLLIPEIIDFDDLALQLPENLERRIARRLEEKAFESYLHKLIDLRIMQEAGVSLEGLQQQSQRVRQALIDDFNGFTEERRPVLRFDTTEKLNDEVWNRLATLVGSAKNAVFLLAGRNGEELLANMPVGLGLTARLIELEPLDSEACRRYLERKQEQLHIKFEPELAEKLLLLSEGRPILIDLAVEWLSRDVPLPWLMEMSLAELSDRRNVDLSRRQAEFEGQLVAHIADVRSPMDRLTLVLSHVYPLSMEMVSRLLNITGEEAADLFEEARSYVYVKTLPDDRITLHDVMRDMVNEHVWPQVARENDRRRQHSRIAIEFLRQEIEALLVRIEEIADTQKAYREEKNAQEELAAFTRREALEREVWELREKLVIHSFIADLDKGVAVFAQTFDQAAAVSRYGIKERLLNHAQAHIGELSQAQLYEIQSREFETLLFRGRFAEAEELVSTILERKEHLSPKQIIRALIQRGNARVRQGRVREGRLDFQEAVEVCEGNQLEDWLIRARNGLGWAHRLEGNPELAKYYYMANHRALVKRKELGEDYGWLLNNLTFVLSERERHNAINLGETALNHWLSLGNPTGIGAAHSTLGIVYYRSDISDKSLDHFNQALRIFEDLRYDEWKGRIYSWRGALYQDIGELDKAEADLRLSLEIGPRDIRAMTLNRLGRVFMTRRQWDEAQRYILEALEAAREIPDYIYWLGSIARLIFIAAERGQADRLNEFEAMLAEFEAQGQKPEENSLGMTYLGLARLALALGKVDLAKAYLEKGIPLVTEYGSYARGDVRTRLVHFEKDFDQIDTEIIRDVGQTMWDTLLEKQIGDVKYGLVTNIMYRWAHWREAERQNEAEPASTQ